MARYNRNEFADAPAMIMSPTNDAQLPTHGIGPLSFSTHSILKKSSFPGSCHSNSISWTPVDSMTPISTNPSRKRSRDESDSCGHDGSYFPSGQSNAPAPIAGEPLDGEVMVLLNPSTDLSVSAGSQTGTWHDEKVEIKPKSARPLRSRPELPPSRKSVRLDPAAPPPPDDIATALAPESPSKSSTAHPTIDDFTVALGIGWTRLCSDDPDVQAAARGWARYLENHYSTHIHAAELLLKSEGLNAYLVGSQEGYYLFSEDLLEGRLVGRDWESCWNNLRTHPIAFEGDAILRAARNLGLDVGHINGSRDCIATGKIMANGNGNMDVD